MVVLMTFKQSKTKCQQHIPRTEIFYTQLTTIHSNAHQICCLIDCRCMAYFCATKSNTAAAAAFFITEKVFQLYRQFIAIQSIKATRHSFRWNVITLVALLNDYKIRYFYGEHHKNPSNCFGFNGSLEYAQLASNSHCVYCG